MDAARRENDRVPQSIAPPSPGDAMTRSTRASQMVSLQMVLQPAQRVPTARASPAALLEKDLNNRGVPWPRAPAIGRSARFRTPGRFIPDSRMTDAGAVAHASKKTPDRPAERAHCSPFHEQCAAPAIHPSRVELVKQARRAHDSVVRKTSAQRNGAKRLASSQLAV